MNGKEGDAKKVIVCGGGLVGCLAACYFAQRNFDVTLYEYRSDTRKMKDASGRTLNMAMSLRGREAMRQIGAEEAAYSKGVEAYSRMIHDLKGNTDIVPYGKKDQCILSIKRRFLNELLFNEADKYPNLKIEFDHKLIRCNTSTGSATFENRISKEIIQVESYLCVGCDGSYSVARQCLMRDKPIEYSQEYNSGCYIEMQMPAKNGTYALPPHHLHIWPRGDFMLMALPNQDFTFTLTLFMPFEMFDSIKTGSDLLNFFEKYFFDTLDLIGRQFLIDSFFSVTPEHLVSIKCSSHHGKKFVLLGDSAHAMVPFYGQGMNCGFEDVLVFFEILDKIGFDNLDSVLSTYSEQRVPDSHAICN